MREMFDWLTHESATTIISLWLVVVGAISVAYFIYEGVRRDKKLKHFGLSEEHSTSDSKKESPFVRISRAMSSFFSASDLEVAEKLVAAGFYKTDYAYLLLPLKYLLLFCGSALIVTLGIQYQVELNKYGLWAGIWAIVMIIGPDYYLAYCAKKLRRKLSNQLPYLLDLMGVCVQTGMTVESAMAYLAQEMVGFDRDLAHMLKRTNDRAQIVGLEQSIEELYVRVPTPEFRSFVMTLNQSLQYGSSIYSVLTTLAVDIREVQMLNLEEKIGKLAAKMSIPLILFIMVPIVILITAPGIMRLM